MDYVQQKCLLNIGTADLYGSSDPFQRMPKSPKALPNTDEVEVVKVDKFVFGTQDKVELNHVSRGARDMSNLCMVSSGLTQRPIVS